MLGNAKYYHYITKSLEVSLKRGLRLQSDRTGMVEYLKYYIVTMPWLLTIDYAC